MTDDPPPVGRKLIINADDFGLSPGVDRGILEAFRKGVLSSTTMLVNLDHFEHASDCQQGLDTRPSTAGNLAYPVRSLQYLL